MTDIKQYFVTGFEALNELWHNYKIVNYTTL